MPIQREVSLAVQGGLRNPRVITGAYTASEGYAIAYIVPNPSVTLTGEAAGNGALLNTTGASGGTAVTLLAPMAGVYSSIDVTAGSALVYEAAVV